jgi:hypothetical protein
MADRSAPAKTRSPLKRQWLRLVAALAVALAAIGFAATLAQAETPVICGGLSPQNVPEVMNLTWSGTVTKISTSNRITFAIDHVYAQQESEEPQPTLTAGGTVTLPNELCNPIRHLKVGHRYLVSTYEISQGPSSEETAIWEFSGDQLVFVDIYGTVNSEGMNLTFRLPPDFAAADTLAAVINLVAPGAELPSTDTVAPFGGAAGPAGLEPLLVVAGMLGFALGWYAIRQDPAREKQRR